MLIQSPHVSHQELKRVLNLAEFDIDYANIQDNFKDLATLASKIAGTDISLINLIDSFTQWTIGSQGFELIQMPREDSVCNYTVASTDYFEVPNFLEDERFKDKEYVTGPLQLRYYLGIPLTTAQGFNIGSICIVHRSPKKITQPELDMLGIVAKEVVNRLKNLHAIDSLRGKLMASREAQRRVSHEIRSPIAGIIGLASLIEQQGEANSKHEVLESMMLIERSARTVLDIANQTFIENSDTPVNDEEFNLSIFKDKLEQLYLPQAQKKGIQFSVKTSHRTSHIRFAKHKLLQIAGNLLYNAIKFTPEKGTVDVELELKPEATHNLLKIKVNDSGIAMQGSSVADILAGHVSGYDGETGFGFGLSLVKKLIESLDGEFKVRPFEGEGATFEILIRQSYQ